MLTISHQLPRIATFLYDFLEHCDTLAPAAMVGVKSGDGFGADDVTQVKLLLMRMRLAFGKLIVCPPPPR